MGKIMCSKLKMVYIHRKQLINTIQEEDEVWSIVFAIIHVWPLLHCQPISSKIRCYIWKYLSINHFSVFTLQNKSRPFQKVMPKIEPLFIDQGSETFKSSIVWINQNLSKWTDNTGTIISSRTVNQDVMLVNRSLNIECLLQSIFNLKQPINLIILVHIVFFIIIVRQLPN